MRLPLLTRYRSYLPVTPQTPLLTLGEGFTPLVRSHYLEGEIGAGELYFKLEFCNPTGSFKDRGMVVAVAKGLEAGSRLLLCASTGNTSASAAAYGAACGLPVAVVVPKGAIAQGKLSQAQAYGARVFALPGGFDQALQLVQAVAQRVPATVVNSINPHRLEGQKTAAFEIVDELGDAPDGVCLPVGNAGNIAAYWRGFREYRAAGKAARTPRMMGFQAEGAAPLVRGSPVLEPRTFASAIRIGNPANWAAAVAARDESGGLFHAVSDEEILAAALLLARREGLFVEPASAASVAGLLKLARQGHDFSGQRLVCVLTGSGLKDPDAVALYDTPPIEEAPADPVALARLLGCE